MSYDYGRAGTVAIGTPQANPTVEAEMRILLPPTLLAVTTRLTSPAATPEERLRDYLLGLERTLQTLDTLRPRAFGFACTASAYLVAEAETRRTLSACADRFGYPVVTAAAAIEATLHDLGARRIALVSPYPAPLREHAIAYWQGRGFAVAPVIAAGDLAPEADTRGIYAMGSADARGALARIDPREVDAILLSGTGLPSLPLVADWAERTPLLSSNLCLADALARAVGQPSLLDPAAWRDRCAAAIQEAST